MRRLPRIRTAALLALLAACSGHDTVGPVTDTARLRVVNGSQSAQTVDLFADGKTILQGVGNTQASDFITLATGSRLLTLRNHTTGDSLAAVHAVLDKDQEYTLVAAGLGGNVDLYFAADTGRVPAPGKVKFRVMHAAPNGPAIDVYLTPDTASLAGALPLITPFDFGAGLSDSFPGYVERDPGTWRVRFTDRGTLNLRLDTGGFPVAAGDVYDVMVINGPAPDSTSLLGLSIVKE